MTNSVVAGGAVGLHVDEKRPSRRVHGLSRGVHELSQRTHRPSRGGRGIAVLLAFVLSLIGAGIGTAQMAQSQGGPVEVTSYIVKPGDTLWSYASHITPPGEDVSQTVDELISLNHLDSGSLRVGQRIVVPVEEVVG
ncbi:MULTISPECIES: LysM peptidoglycan-binding domain-containing protein [Bifidobacterium]|uniref:LysM peptidoglycan-binding domain-containing protein n=1 Tax=Bifidobacterium myosotis TaxID=1630166 RepID=A0A261FF25_9BIFI|nr:MULTISPECIES: LysM peptidoglycan-binding domain-containing protein [Bifidobacterium]KAA8827791.1 LysM peptidoglycan-binding domain-containing protein [Bifidobacterium myosotis]OZG57734.1 peptidoglycan-binding protein LysM [Bifidobacterium myosotis]